jgi:hypothetical protein
MPPTSSSSSGAADSLDATVERSSVKRSSEEMQKDYDTIMSSSVDIDISLRNEETAIILEVFRELREKGIDEVVPLPQLVVGGDTSSGKSAVLSRLTGLAFPSSAALETRFATEVILRAAKEESITIKIQPDNTRPIEQFHKLQTYKRQIRTPAEFLSIHEEASGLICSQDGNNGNLTMDNLVVNISGPSQQPLAIVDLPGLIHATGGGDY